MDGLTTGGAQTVRLENDAARIAGMQKLKAQGKSIPKERIDEIAQDFEAVFITQMLEHMFEGVETNEVFGGGSSEEIYRSFLLDEYGKLISRAGGVGVADHVKREMLKLQEVH